MNLTEEPEIVDFAPMHYVFVEKTGPFMKIAPEAWQTLHSLSPLLKEHNQITSGVSLYRMDPNTYRAGRPRGARGRLWAKAGRWCAATGPSRTT